MRLPRMTTRQWMIVILIIALDLGGFIGVRAVWQYFMALNRLQHHEGMEESSRYWANFWDRLERDAKDGMAGTADLPESDRRAVQDGWLKGSKTFLDLLRRNAALERRKAEYHAAMARKYGLVARMPWLPVDRDPPEPD